MSEEELARKIAAGVEFWGFEASGSLVGVIGRQDRGDVALIRHAYVLPAYQRRGLGAGLLQHLLGQEGKRVLVGTWAAASWAIRFYEKHGFRLLTAAGKNRLLRTYWSISERQVETSVVLADAKFFTHSQSHPEIWR